MIIANLKIYLDLILLELIEVEIISEEGGNKEVILWKEFF